MDWTIDDVVHLLTSFILPLPQAGSRRIRRVDAAGDSRLRRKVRLAP
jgi:hypothetical protein